MRNYDVRPIRFCLTVKYAKEYWVSEEYKMNYKFKRSRCTARDQYSD